MLFSTTTALSLLALVPLAITTPVINPGPSPVEDSPDQRPSDPAALSMTWFPPRQNDPSALPIDVHTCEYSKDRHRQTVNIYADGELHITKFPTPQPYFQTTISKTPVPAGSDVILYETKDCTGQGTRLTVFDTEIKGQKTSGCNRARNGAGAVISVNCVSVKWPKA